MNTTEPTILNADDLIAKLGSDSAFYQDWFSVAVNTLLYFFKSRDGEVYFYNKYNSLSYSVEEVCSARMGDLIRKALNTSLKQYGYQVGYDALSAAKTHFMKKLISGVTQGEICLPDDITCKLSVIYGDGQSPVNIAQSSRTLNISRYAVTKLMDTYSADLFRRYQQVQQGKAYAIVMGDCKPFIHDQPQFTPLITLEENDPRCTELLIGGALVAEKMSSRFYTVEKLGYSGGLVFAHNAIVHFPLTVLPLQYREVASRFCRCIMPSDNAEAA